METFYESLIVGLVVGILLVVLHRWFMFARSKDRREKGVDVAMLAHLKLDDLQKICKDNFPSWVSFPEYERVRWINSLLKEIWPYVNKAASRVIKESVEPKLEQYRPMAVQSIGFDKLTLGDVAPQIGGIKMHKVNESQLIMDVDLKWGGDPNIVIGISTVVVSLPVALKDLTFFATARIIFEFAGKIPCIGAVVVSLLAKPKPLVGYNLKAIGGSLTSMPGLAGMIDEIVQGALSDSIVWPKRIVVPLIPGYVTSHLELRIQGKLTVTVVRASGLKNVDLVGKSDPFVVLWTRPLFKVKTKCIDDDLDPVWDETFELDVEEAMSTKLELKVRDQGMLMDEALGQQEVSVASLVPEQWVELSLFLLPESDDHGPPNKDRGLGKILLRMMYHQYTPEEQEVVMAFEKELVEARKKGKLEPGMIGGAAQMASKSAGAVAKGAGSVVGGGAKLIVGGLTGAAKMGMGGAGALGKGASGAVSRVFSPRQ